MSRRDQLTSISTVPVRCKACGQETHKGLAVILAQGGLICECGAHTDVDLERFSDEIRRAQDSRKDFGRDG
jgi:hypothetical protein